MREKAAMRALDDLLDWLENSGQLAILDATVGLAQLISTDAFDHARL
jgi:hypothetical protein